MYQRSSKTISINNSEAGIVRTKLNSLLENVGDMSLKRRARRIIEEIDPKPNDKIIDLGCGDGYYLYLLRSLPVNLKLSGLDIDQKALDNAKKTLKNPQIKISRGDLTKLPFKSNSFDKVISTEVIEHIDNDLMALQQIRRVLKNNGILVLTTTNINHPFLWDPINWLLMKLFNTHIKTGFFAGIWFNHNKLYETKALKKLITRAGFKVEFAEELTTRCLPFNHYLVNLVARILYDSNLPSNIIAPVSKFQNVRKPLWIRLAFLSVNLFDKLNDVLPGKHGVNILVKARKVS